MSIYGVGKPFFRRINDPWTPYTIDYATIISKKVKQDNIINKSQISGDIAHYAKGSHIEIVMKINIFKSTAPVPGALLRMYWELMNEPLEVRLHVDGDAFKDAAGAVVPFKIISFETGYVTQAHFEDIIIMKLVSIKYIDLFQSI